MRRLFWLATISLSSLGHAVVHYQVTFQPDAKRVLVAIQADAPAKTETYRIPAWSPGFYQIEKFQKGISHVAATTSDGQSLQVRHTDARAWQVNDAAGKPYSFTYQVSGDDDGLGFFGTAVSDDHGFINGASAFMNLDGRTTEPTKLKISTPAGWDVAIPLDANAEGEYEAGGYDELIDSPIQVGKFERRTFTAQDIPFQVVYVAPDDHPRADLDLETGRFAKLVLPALKLYGGAPFRHYTFIIHLAPGNFSGGLEHRASTVINIQNTDPLGIDDLITHEYFHAWNVKNIRPAVLGPFDYTKEVRTDNLWFAEGVTDYYAKLDAFKSGLENLDYLFAQFSEQVGMLQKTRDRTRYTLAQASRGAWEGDSEGLGDLSYYEKGLISGLTLDADIRGATNGQKSLDDVMRLLYQRHRLPQPGYAENEILATVNEVAGIDLKPVYDRLIYSTKEVPYDDLRKIGIRAIIPNQPFQDPGFHLDSNRHITRMSDSIKGKGLELDDTLNLVSLQGDQAKYAVDRGTQSFHVTLTVKSTVGDEYEVEPDPLATPEACKLRDEWLKR